MCGIYHDVRSAKASECSAMQLSNSNMQGMQSALLPPPPPLLLLLLPPPLLLPPLLLLLLLLLWQGMFPARWQLVSAYAAVK